MAKLLLSFMLVFFGVFSLCWHFRDIIKVALQNRKVVLLGLVSAVLAAFLSVCVVYFL